MPLVDPNGPRVRPYYARSHYDTSWWEALSSVEGERVTFGPYTVWWEGGRSSSYGRGIHMQTNPFRLHIMVPLTKNKNAEGAYLGPWEKWTSSEWTVFRDISTDWIDDLRAEVLKVFLEDRKRHNREVNAKAKLARKNRAEELGVSLEELSELDKVARAEKKIEKQTAKSADQLERLLKVGGHLLRLREDIDFLEKVINKDVSKLNIKYTDSYLEKLHKARQVLRTWAGQKRCRFGE